MDIAHHLDSLTLQHALGWAFSRSGSPVRIQVWEGDCCVADQLVDGVRADVAAGHPAYPNSGRSGFAVPFSLTDARALSDVRVRLVSTDGNGGENAMEIGAKALLTETAVAHLLTRTKPGPGSAFPRGVAGVILSLWPDAPVESHRPEDQIVVVDYILQLARQPWVDGLGPVTAYMRFLRQAWAHFQFVDRHFPVINANRSPGDVDFTCKPNSPEELFTIAHHLYVLKSHGVRGAFAEFGCFKGFSTAMLSQVCRMLDVPMHVFDSFAGLPTTESTVYSEGEYAGSLAEVTRHVTWFGAPEVVTFHEGFFSDTLATFDVPPLMAMWMDVDLESSARDVMTVFDRLDPRSAVFTHECDPHYFIDDRIEAPRDINTVVPSILDAFEKAGVFARGRHLHSATGVLWRRDGGLPVLGKDALTRLVASA